MKRLIYIGNFLSKNKQNPAPNVLIVTYLKSFFKVITSSSRKNIFIRFIDMLYTVLRFARHENSVVVIDVFSSKAFYFAFFVASFCRFIKVKIILALHGGDLPSRYKRSPRLSDRLFNTAELIIAPSKYLKRETESFFPVQVEIFENPLQIEMYPYLPERNFDIPKIIWIRSFHVIYNPQLAIHVIKRTKQYFPGAKLCMVGPDKDGSLHHCKALVKELGLEDTVEFTGFLNKAALVEKSKDCNIFINTTNFDNTPVSVVEAMALGLPVITTNVGGIPDLIDHEINGLVIEPRNEQAFYDSIKRVMEDVMLRNKIIINGRRKSETMAIQNIGLKWRRRIDEIIQ